MDKKAIDEKYVKFIESLIVQVTPLLPEDVNELQKNYLVKNMRNSAMTFANSMQEDDEFKCLDFETQCFYLQVFAEWSFHKEIDLFRSGIPAKYWKTVMQKIWHATWEVMYACVKNEAPQSVVLSLVERFINRTYNDAVEELKEQKIIDEKTEEQAKEQSNIAIMAQEIRTGHKISRKISLIITRTIFAIIIGAIVSVMILKLKTFGLIIILTILLVYNFIPMKDEE